MKNESNTFYKCTATFRTHCISEIKNALVRQEVHTTTAFSVTCYLLLLSLAKVTNVSEILMNIYLSVVEWH
jgi:hypothetical protein